MSYAILRLAKHQKGTVCGVQKHNQREHKNYSNFDIDKSKTHLNYDLINNSNINYTRAWKENKEKYFDKDKLFKSNTVVLVEGVITSDRSFFQKMNNDEIKKYFQANLEFLENRYGKHNIVSANVHLDETTPHMHFTFTPITSDGRYSARDVIGNRGDLRQLQDDYHKYLTDKGYSLLRGAKIEETKTKHQAVKAYKKEQIDKDHEEIHKIKQELKELKLKNLQLKNENYEINLENNKLKNDLSYFNDRLDISLQADRKIEELSSYEKSTRDMVVRIENTIVEERKLLGLSDNLIISKKNYNQLALILDKSISSYYSLVKDNKETKVELLDLKDKNYKLDSDNYILKNQNERFIKELKESSIKLNKAMNLIEKTEDKSEQLNKKINYIERALKVLGKEKVEEVNNTIKELIEFDKKSEEIKKLKEIESQKKLNQKRKSLDNGLSL